MRFTPTSFFGSGDIESCISVRGTGAVSESFSVNGVNWDILMYSCSLQRGGSTTGSGVEDFEFYVDEGTTRHAVIAVVGAGGAGSSDGKGGGGGEVKVATNVSLTKTESIPYQISVGNGGSGTYRTTLPGLPFSGEDGNRSYFRGYSVDVTSQGGQGGNLGGFGGSSGNGYTSSEDGGAGAATGSNCGDGGAGFTIFKLFSGNDTTKIVRAGGGGDGESPKTSCGYDHQNEEFGGGGGPGDGGQTSFGVVCYGGGAEGGQYYNAITDVYESYAGGGGFVMVAVPTNLCTASLYSKGDIVFDNLLSNYQATNAVSFGKDMYDTQFKDTQRVANLTNTTTTYTDVRELFTRIYTGSTPILSYNDSVKVLDLVEGGSFQDRAVDYSLQGSLPLNTSNGFTLEYYGKMPDDVSAGDSDVMSIQSKTTTADITLYRERTGTGGDVKVRYDDGVTSQLTNDVEVDIYPHQHVITFDGSNIKYYLDTRLQDTIITSVTSSLNNPDFKLFAVNQFQEGVYNAPYWFSSSRVYSEALSQTQIAQNYAAETGVVIPQVTPGALIDTFVFDTGSVYRADGVLSTFDWVTSSVTLEVWSNENGTIAGTYDAAIGLNDQIAGGDRDFFEIRYRNVSGNKIFGNNFDGSSDTVTQPYGDNVNLSQWYHSILTWDSGSGQMLYYRDGTLIGSASVPTITTELNAPHYHVGKADTGTTEDMFIGEYRIYPFALNASQSLYNYNQTEYRYI